MRQKSKKSKRKQAILSLRLKPATSKIPVQLRIPLGNKILKYSGHFFGDPDGDECREFRNRHPKVEIAQIDPLYALPKELITKITSVLELKHWFTKSELDFEADLLATCEKHGSLGIAEGTFVNASLLKPVRITGERFTDLTNTYPGEKDPGSVRKTYSNAADLFDSVESQQRAYLGWLLTHPPYLKERDVQRARRQSLCLRVSYCPVFGPQPDHEFAAFLAKWRISMLASWEVPVPQGPNLTGTPWPWSVTKSPGMANISVPDTFSPPASFSFHELIDNTTYAQRPSYLNKWFKILDRKSGEQRFRFHIRAFELHFYRDLVLAARYADRMKGRKGYLDEAFGKFLQISPESVRQTRLQNARRLKN